MANIFTLENVEDFSEKLNIDELYEKKRQFDLNKLALFNKILNRIHIRIKMTSQQKVDEQYCWFVVPEVIIGVAKYDHASCIAYLISKLQENKFNVRYIHPNTLFISWIHFVPSYVRTEIKKKTGIILNEYGQKVDENTDKLIETTSTTNNSNDLLTNKSLKDSSKQQNKKVFTPINTYKPSGNFIYNDELLNKIETKFS
jgi:hypothetical protein